MSYQVLARKWRPQNFAQVVGQEHVTRTLANAITGGRIAHAYLFSGPRGVGKTSIARIFAKSLNCAQGPTATPCGECESCRAVLAGNNFDVIEIDGASNNSVNDIRDLRGNIQYGPTRYNYKIYIIDEVHMLSTGAFNALLKTLEEPPPRTIFIFATTEIHKVPATIISRCQQFDFQRIPLRLMVERLREICVEEEVRIEEESLRLIAARADGGMRDAQSLLDQLIAFAGKEITREQVLDTLGLLDRELFLRFHAILLNRDFTAATAFVEELIFNGHSPVEFLQGLAEHFRNLMIIKLASEDQLTEVSTEHRKQLAEAAERVDDGDLLRMLDLVLESAQTLKRSRDPRLGLELLVFKLLKMERTIHLAEVLAGGGSVAVKPVAPAEGSAPVPRGNSAPRAAAPEKKTVEPQDPETIRKRWPEFCRLVGQDHGLLRAHLENVVPGGLEEGKLILHYPRGDQLLRNRLQEKQPRVEELLRRFFRGVQGLCLVEKELAGETLPAAGEPVHLDDRSRLEELVNDNPALKKLTEKFQTRLI